jgi:MFS transporter, MHS family, citrate/tricarballylate:H+ symporter
VPFGLIIRSNLPETFEVHSREAAPTRPTGSVVRLFILGVLMLGASTIAYYGIEYINTYAQDTLHMSVKLAFGATILLGVVMVITDILCGLMTDKVGRKPIMIAAAVAVVLVIIPAFVILNRFPSPPVIFAVTATLGILSALISGPALISVTESLPKAIRSGVLGTLYAIAMSVFGGTTQFVSKGLIELTGSPLAPAVYITGAMIVGVGAMLMLRETAPVKLKPS